MTMPDPKPQGVILVTEHNAEVNAGFAVLRGSNHAPPLIEEDWHRYVRIQGEVGCCVLEGGLYNGFKWER